MTNTDEERRRRRKEEWDAENESRAFLLFLFGVPVALATDVWWLNRPFLTALIYSIGIAVCAILIVGALNCVGKANTVPPAKELLQWAKDAPHVVTRIIAISFFYYTIGAVISDALTSLAMPTVRHTFTAITTSFWVLILGAVFFIFRLKQRLLYGLSEIGVGLFIASYKAISTNSSEQLGPDFLLVLLTAGVYLVVRGMDNVHQSLTARTVVEKEVSENNHAPK